MNGRKRRVRDAGSWQPQEGKGFLPKVLESYESALGRGQPCLIYTFKSCSDNKSLGLVLALKFTRCVILGQVPTLLNLNFQLSTSWEVSRMT